MVASGWRLYSSVGLHRDPRDSSVVCVVSAVSDCIEIRALVAENPESVWLVSQPLVTYPALERLVIQRPLQSLDLNPLTALSNVNTRVFSAQPHRKIRNHTRRSCPISPAGSSSRRRRDTRLLGA